jgi:hypothetical protein
VFPKTSGVSIVLNLTASPTSLAATEIDLLDPFELIETMIDLRIQLAQIERQIQSLQPAFFAACLTLNQAKIERHRAIISRKLTPAQWTYAVEILEQEALLKQLRKQFQQDHEPTGGRETIWIIKLLLAQPT